MKSQPSSRLRYLMSPSWWPGRCAGFAHSTDELRMTGPQRSLSGGWRRVRCSTCSHDIVAWQQAQALDAALVSEEAVLPRSSRKDPLHAHLAPVVRLPGERLLAWAVQLRLAGLPARRIERLPSLQHVLQGLSKARVSLASTGAGTIVMQQWRKDLLCNDFTCI